MFSPVSLFRPRFLALPLALQRIFLFALVLDFIYITGTLFLFSRNTAEMLFEIQFDKVMHFCGGVFVAGALFIVGFARTRRQIILGVFIVGVLWEIWEIVILPYQQNLFSLHFFAWVFDTILDLSADILGALLWSNLLSLKPPSLQGEGSME